MDRQNYLCNAACRSALPRSFRAQIVCNAGILWASPQAVIPHAFSVLCPPCHREDGEAGRTVLPFATVLMGERKAAGDEKGGAGNFPPRLKIQNSRIA